jgi:hypothetical protein
MSATKQFSLTDEELAAILKALTRAHAPLQWW